MLLAKMEAQALKKCNLFFSKMEKSVTLCNNRTIEQKDTKAVMKK